MIATLLSLLVVLSPQVPATDKPLPELSNFLTEFQTKRPGLFKALGAWGVAGVRFRSQYTWTETCTELALDSSGKVKGSKKNVYEVIPNNGPLPPYRRQTVKDGVPLSQKELDKQDREYDSATAKRKEQIRKAAQQAPAAPRPALQPQLKFLDLYDFQMVRRESLKGHPVILLNFKPKTNYQPVNIFARMLSHAAGRVWISEDDYELVRVEIEVIEPISLGAGLLAKIQKGSKASMEFTKINDEIWLPYHREFTADGRLLLLKGMHESEVTDFSNHKKYVVDTQLQFGDPVDETGKK